ncbi:unnamed protein product [Pocillopora meandrina]|uniref:Uncharacterized protein n=1 Tax=Pocillopora meandrina TaxID=46732 RepID=A0AAU9X0G3_9CNID|nr:unnamed protein product [Pocillopora meandrina]
MGLCGNFTIPTKGERLWYKSVKVHATTPKVIEGSFQVLGLQGSLRKHHCKDEASRVRRMYKSTECETTVGAKRLVGAPKEKQACPPLSNVCGPFP